MVVICIWAPGLWGDPRSDFGAISGTDVVLEPWWHRWYCQVQAVILVKKQGSTWLELMTMNIEFMHQLKLNTGTK